ncbi:MAG: S24/S26 family peptidase [Bacteroidota bacterium]
MKKKTKIVRNDIFFDEIADRVAAGKKVIIKAKGESMRPFIRNGCDKIILEKLESEDLKKGNIVLVRLSDGRFVVHRIEKVEKEGLVLRGDGNLATLEVCRFQDVVAQATAVVHNGKMITKGSIRWKWQGWLWPSGVFLRRLLLGLDRRWSRKTGIELKTLTAEKR